MRKEARSFELDLWESCTRPGEELGAPSYPFESEEEQVENGLLKMPQRSNSVSKLRHGNSVEIVGDISHDYPVVELRKLPYSPLPLFPKF